MIKRLLIISALALSAVTATAFAEGNGYINITSPSKIEILEQDAPVYLFGEDKPDGTPNDEFYAQYQWNLEQINMPKVWAKGYRGEGATICVIDSGLNLEHDDFDVSRVVGKYNIFDENDDVTDAVAKYVESDSGTYVESKGNMIPIEEFIAGGGVVTEETVKYEKKKEGHGTLVTGIISAITNNGKGIAGVADKADIVVVKAFDADHETDTDMLISTLEYVALNYPEVDVINMSEGTVEAMDNDSKNKFKKAVDALVDKGVIIIASVGNEGNSLVSYPAGFDNVIGVGGTSKNKVKCAFSQFNDSVFVSAPGGIENPGNKNNHIATLGSTGNDIVAASGTSFAAPQVAGIAAIAKSIYPELTTNQFKEILKKTSEDLTAVPSYFDEEFTEQLGDLTGYDTLYGYGLIDADKIITEVEKLKNNEYTADSYRVLDYVKDEEGAGVVVETDDLSASVYIASYDENNAPLSVRRVDISDLESEAAENGIYCRYRIPLLENEPEPSKLFLWHGMIGCKTWEPSTETTIE